MVHDQLTTHPKLGASWEGFALDCVCRSVNKRDDEFFFYATHTGAELDLFWQTAGKNWGVEFKYSDAPKMTKSMAIVLADLKLAHLWIVYPGDQGYRLQENVSVVPLRELNPTWQYPTEVS